MLEETPTSACTHCRGARRPARPVSCRRTSGGSAWRTGQGSSLRGPSQREAAWFRRCCGFVARSSRCCRRVSGWDNWTASVAGPNERARWATPGTTQRGARLSRRCRRPGGRAPHTVTCP